MKTLTKISEINICKSNRFAYVKRLVERDNELIEHYYFEEKENKIIYYCLIKDSNYNYRICSVVYLLNSRGKLQVIKIQNDMNYVDCPVEYLTFLNPTRNIVKRAWRMKVIENNFRLCKKIVLRAVYLTLRYEDSTKFYHDFKHKINLDAFPNALNLKVGDTIDFGTYGTVKESDFFNSKAYNFSKDFYKLNPVLQITEIKQIKEM